MTGVKGFHIGHRAWYARPDMPIDIMIGVYYPGEGCEAEFCITWHSLGARRLCPCLEIFDDAWKLFFTLTELHGLASLPADASVDDIAEFLLRVGYKDLTNYVEVQS